MLLILIGFITCVKHKLQGIQVDSFCWSVRMSNFAFSIPGMFPTLRSLDNEEFNLNEIRIFRDDISKEASEADISTRPTVGEEFETMGTPVPCIAEITTKPVLGEETEAPGTLVPSTAADEGLQVHDGSLLETICGQELTLVVDGGTLLKEVDFVDNEVIKEVSQYDVSGEKVGVEFDDVRTSVGGEAIHSVASGAEPLFSVGHVAEVNCNSTDDIKANSPSLQNSSDVLVSMHTDISDQILDHRCATNFSIDDTSTGEGVSGSGIRDQGVDVGVTEKAGVGERSDAEPVSEKRESVDPSIVMEHLQDTCSLPVHDSSISESVALEDRAFPTPDQVLDGCHPDELGMANKDEIFDSDLRLDDSCSTPYNVSEHVKLDISYSVEADLSPRITTLNEGEGLQYREADQMIAMDSTSIPPEFVDAGNNAVSDFLINLYP